MTPIDAILIPGGGMLADGKLPPWTSNRLDRAIARHKDARYLITLSAATVYKPPPLDRTGRPIFESIAAAGYLVERGIDPRRILTETASYDTIGNAWFARVIHTDPRGLRNLLVITSGFHMPRTEAAFRWVYSLQSRSCGSLSFESVPDIGLDQAALDARWAKEQASLSTLKTTASRITTLEAFHEWLFTEHRVYAATHLNATHTVGDPNILMSY